MSGFDKSFIYASAQDISKLRKSPPDIKTFLTWAEYFLINEGLVATIVSKMAQFVVTDLVIEPDCEEARSLRDILYDNNILEWLVNFNAIILGYGNLFLTVTQKFNRMLVCRHCKTETKISEVRLVTIRNYEIVAECPKCKKVGPVDIHDIAVQSKKLTFKVWDPKFITIDPDHLGHKNRYLLEIPSYIRNRVNKISRLPTTYDPRNAAEFEEAKAYLETLDPIFLKAMKFKKMLLFSDREILHKRRIGIYPFWWTEWGIPIHGAALPDLYSYHLLKMYRNYLAKERTIPIRFVFPQGDVGIYRDLNMAQHSAFVRKAIKEWMEGKDAIHYIPIPIGYQNLGGEGAVIDLEPLLINLEKKIIISCGVPQEFVYGGISTWTGSGISLRMFENNMRFLINIDNQILRFIKERIAIVFGVKDALKHIQVRLAMPKVFDDIARQRLILELNARNLLSDVTLLKELGFDPDAEHENTIEDMKKRAERQIELAKAQARAQAEVAKIQAATQPEAQKLQQEILSAYGIEWKEFIQLPPEYQAFVNRLLAAQPHERVVMIETIKQSSPNMYRTIMKVVNKILAAQQQQLAQEQQEQQQEEQPPKQEVSPEQQQLPEQKPPRRRNY